MDVPPLCLAFSQTGGRSTCFICLSRSAAAAAYCAVLGPNTPSHSGRQTRIFVVVCQQQADTARMCAGCVKPAAHLFKLEGQGDQGHAMVCCLVHAVHAAVAHKSLDVGVPQHILQEAAA